MTAEVSSLRENLRSLPREAWILFIGSFINRFGSFVHPFLIFFLTSKGYSIPAAGFAVGCYGAGHLAAVGLGGYLADRIGRRNTIALSMFSSAAAMLALSQASTYTMLLVLTFLAGMTTELYRPSSAALLADLVPAERRATAYAMYRLAINAAFAAGPATAGFLAGKNFLYLFVGDAITSIIFGVVALIFLPHGQRSERDKSGWSHALRPASRDKAFLLFLVATLCITLVDFQMASTVALHITKVGFTPAIYGALISVNGVLIILFEVPITQWTMRRPFRTVIAAGYFAQGIGFALTGLATTIPALLATVVIWTIGEMVSAPAASTYVANIAPTDLRGRYLGMWTGMWSLGLMLGPWLGTALFARHASILWLLCAVLGTLAAILVLIRPSPAPIAVSQP